MKFLEANFIDYTQKSSICNLHPEIKSLFNNFTEDNIYDSNIILYGPAGVGKYTQALNIIKVFSPTNLKYERKINFQFHKKFEYIFKISDIHFEVDMELLGCNAKILWNDIYNRILDIISARPNHKGIIICKNFHKIHSELLDNFYSYMQAIDHKNTLLSYIIITEQISFLPDNILKRCSVFPIKRPTKKQYEKALHMKLTINLPQIQNIKDILIKDTQLISPNKKIIAPIIDSIIHYKTLDFLELRDNLYNIMIYHLDMTECIWEILTAILKQYPLEQEKICDILSELYKFFRYYNNNYRPIYHLEKFILYLCKVVNDLGTGS
jgi:Cdc6-like AAA superfamily ATPase